MDLETITCSRCREPKPLEAFSPKSRKPGQWCRRCRSEWQRERRQNPVTTRITDVCLECGVSIEGYRAHAKFCGSACSMKNWHRAHPGRQREYWVKSVYGLTVEAYETLFEAQGRACAICRTTTPEGTGRIKQWNVDHNHETGAVRGILCSQCNIGIGQLRDDPALLRAAIAYLERV